MLVSNLKEDLGYVNVFLIVFNGETHKDTNQDQEMYNMINLLEANFGKKFWNNVMLEVDDWGFDERTVQKRTTTEQQWREERIDYMRNNFNISENAPLETVFIHSFYDKDKPYQEQNFTNYANKLWNFAANVMELEVKDREDIEAERDDLQDEVVDLKNQNNQLHKDKTEKQNKINELNDDLIDKEDEINDKKDEIKRLEAELKEARGPKKAGLEVQYVVIIAFVCFGIGVLTYRIVNENCTGKNNHTQDEEDEDKDLEVGNPLEEADLPLTENAHEAPNVNIVNDTSND